MHTRRGVAVAAMGLSYVQYPSQLERAMVLLAYEDPAASPEADGLLDQAQRERTARALNAAILSAQELEEEPTLPMMLRAMLHAQEELLERQRQEQEQRMRPHPPSRSPSPAPAPCPALLPTRSCQPSDAGPQLGLAGLPW